MCRKQPGRRCPRHCAERLDRSLSELAALRADPHTTAEALQKAYDQARLDRVDLDSTGTGRSELSQRIADLEGHSGKKINRRRKELTTRLIAGQALADEWGRQASLMPPPPDGDDVEGRKMHRLLGKTRGHMARCQVQMLLNRDSPADLQRWAAEHRQAAADALDMHSRLRMRGHNGKPDWAMLSEREQHEWRADRVQRPALALLSHKRAVATADPDGFRTEIPLTSAKARESGQVYAGAGPEPQPETDTPAADGGHGDTPDTSDAPSGDAGKTGEAQQTPQDRHRRRAARRAAAMHRAELRRLYLVSQRAGMVARKAEQGSGKPGFNAGGLFMLDYFTANVK